LIGHDPAVALVVTAPTHPVASRSRLLATFRWLLASAAIGACAAYVVQSLSRVALPVGSFDEVVSGLWMAVGILAFAAAVVTWVVQRDAPALLLAASLSPLLIALRIAAVGVFATLELPTLAGVAETALGLLAVGCLVASILIPWPAPARTDAASTAADNFFRRVAEVSALVVFAAGVSGAAVSAVGASWACATGFPDCNGLGVLPFGRDPLADIQLYHRLLAYLSTALVLWLAIESVRTQRHRPSVRRAAFVLGGSTLLEGAVGAVGVAASVPVLAQAVHALVGLTAWSAAIGVVVLAHRGASVGVAVAQPRPSVLAAYIQLTKPKVMSLLLATTTAAMFIAARGMPPLDLLLATLLGGALMSGGAGAINHYIDRDIDPLMGRTAWRPIPSGIIAPNRALWFGILLAVIATLVLVLLVNPLAAFLSLLGLLGYVFIYTLWLKRSTPSNIVIGGAAGAIPPLVGWAAITNEVGSLTAWYLFAIIFFWTPPHFWALSLLIRKHYERAGVPMLPVVRGEDETRRQIALYSLVLVALTLVLSPFGLMGLTYFGAAIVLGAIFIWAAVRLWREATPKAARRLYLYSMLYLFALFAAMAVDRVML